MRPDDPCRKLVERIENRTARVSVIGLGYVGLPLAIAFAKKGFPVTGFDIDDTKCAHIKSAKSYIRHIPLDPVKHLIEDGVFDATSDFSRIGKMDCIIICVPTPLTEKRVPDLSALENTADTIARFLRKGQLVVLESTSYPGTTEEILLERFKALGMTPGADFFLAFSPEREDPGNKLFSVANTPKIVGGITPACLEAANALYSTLTKTVPVRSTRIAEFAKILENTFRAVNIALVNELKMLAHRMDIDIFEVIDAAATKPFGFMPFYPGPGLGGHCIPIDPFYLTWKAKEYGVVTRFIELAGEINTMMPDYVVARTAQALNRHGKCINGSTILVLGVAYKKDVDDERESPAYPIMKSLSDQGANVVYNDPWIPRLRPTRKYDFKMESVPLDEKTLQTADAVIILTAHSDYDFDFIAKHSRLIIDTRNATAGVECKRDKIVTA